VGTVLGRRIVAIIALVVLAVGVYVVVEFNVAKGLPWSVSFSTVATLAVTVVLALVGPVRKLYLWTRGPLPISDTTLGQAREDLARTLADGWAEEERLRRIYDPWPLPVRWSGTDAGQFEEIGRFFTGLPSHRLVVLGQAGAGKTALAVKLVRELLEARKPGDPVPVLLPAASWTDPRTLTDWVAGQLVLDHPGLAVAVRTGTGDIVPLARSLAANEVLPVIDGLDELPEERRAQVIAEINAHGSDRPVVLTSRPDEYQAATVTRPVTLATVISLVPLDLSDVRAYLQEATEAPADRWRPVLDDLDADPGGPLAQALTNPLMVWLARTVYEQGSTQPGELADHGRFADRDAIEGHLLAGFVPAAYASPGVKRGFRCSPAQAQRWLGFLAHWQSREDTPDITWWRLCLAEPGWSALFFTLRVVLYMCVAWAALSWALIQRGYWRAGTRAFHGGFRDLLLDGPLGRSVRPLMGPLAKALPPGFDHDVDSFLHPVAASGLTGTAFLAVVAGLFFSIFTVKEARAPQTPRLTFATFRTQVLGYWIWLAIFAYLWWGSQARREPIPLIAPQWRTKLVLIWLGILTVRAVLGSLAVPVDVSSAAGPGGLLRRTRWVYLLGFSAALTEVAIVWLWAGTTFAIAAAWVTVAGVIAIPEVAAGSAWPRYIEARFRLFLRRRLPWRTLPFLADARRRGVLRQVGAAYQFRHIRLQEQLAGGYSPWPPLLAPLAFLLGPWGEQASAAAGDAWTAASERLAQWRADPQTVTIDTDTISGDITPRSPSDVVRRHLHSSALVVLIGVMYSVLVGFLRWYLCCAGLFLVAAVLFLSYWVWLRRHEAGAGVVPSSWSVAVIADGFRVSRDGAAVAVDMSDIEGVAAQPVRKPDGSRTEWTALQARLRRQFTVPFPLYGRYLPLVWLTTGKLGENPELVQAVRWFPESLLSPQLAKIKRVRAIEYTASGTVEAPSVPWVHSVLPSFAAGLALFLLGQRVLGILCFLGCLGMLGICVYRSDQRIASRELAEGPWSLRVSPDGIHVEANGVTTHLGPDDILEVDLRVLSGVKGKNTLFSVVAVRARAGTLAPSLTRDGWFPVYRKLIFDTTRTPTELVAALHGIAGQRFGAKLARLVNTKGIQKD